jgi:hypothetical protein
MAIFELGLADPIVDAGFNLLSASETPAWIISLARTTPVIHNSVSARGMFRDKEKLKALGHFLHRRAAVLKRLWEYTIRSIGSPNKPSDQY